MAKEAALTCPFPIAREQADCGAVRIAQVWKGIPDGILSFACPELAGLHPPFRTEKGNPTMATEKQNQFNLSALSLLKALFPDVIFECVFIAAKYAVTKRNGKPVTANVTVKAPKNGKGWTGKGTGSTVETLMDSVAVLAAMLKQRAILGKEKGRVPANILAEMRDAWAQFDTPELRAAAERMILDAGKAGKKTKLAVEITRDGKTVTGHYSNRDADLISRLMGIFHATGIAVKVDGKVIDTAAKKAA
jgi:hypothetical protein